jgi:hypothetical protein
MPTDPIIRRTFESPRKRLDDKVKMYIREMGCENQRWVQLAANRNQEHALELSILNLWIFFFCWLGINTRDTIFWLVDHIIAKSSLSGNVFLFLQFQYISKNMKHGSFLEDKGVD